MSSANPGLLGAVWAAVALTQASLVLSSCNDRPLVADHELGRPIVAIASLGVLAPGGLHPTDSVLALAEDGQLLVYIEPDACESRD